MPKVQVLKINRLVMTALGVYPRTPHLSSRLKWMHSYSPCISIIGMTSCSIFSALYIYQGFGIVRSSYIFEALGVLLGGFEALCVYINMSWKMDTVADFHSKLQEIADQGNRFEFKSLKNSV